MNFGRSEIAASPKKINKPEPRPGAAKRSRLRLALASLLALLVLPFFLPPLPSGIAGRPLPSKEAILEEARSLLDQKEKVRQVISTLEGYAREFPDEVRFPLYLAEAYYRVAEAGADVAGESPYYEKTEAYARKVLEMAPDRTEARYWYGLALLKKAQKQCSPGAYFIVRNAIKELEKVRQSLPAYDNAGPSRVLALLYRLAPRWTPFGDLDKSIKLAQEATRLAPDYPLNRMYLADAYKKRGDRQDAIREYLEILAFARRHPEERIEVLCQEARDKLRALGHPI